MAAVAKIALPVSITIVRWKVKKGSRIFKGSVLGLYDEVVPDKPPSSGDAPSASLKLKASTSGVVDEIHVESGKVVPAGLVSQL
jgi:biotin carboxyl carrier protein